MEAEEYLSQVYDLDKRIDDDIKELDRIRRTPPVISSGSQNRHSAYRGSSDLHVREILLDKKINCEIDNLADLKGQIMTVIGSLSNRNERLILQYRYLKGMPWQSIEKKLNINDSTARRWYANALKHLVIPNGPIKISPPDFS